MSHLESPHLALDLPTRQPASRWRRRLSITLGIAIILVVVVALLALVDPAAGAAGGCGGG